jgi:hypothetical protein
MRSAVNQANRATTDAANTSSRLGAEASGIGSTLTPFLTSELEHPEGYSQQDLSAMLSAASAGAGGATSGIVGKANQEAATSRNAGGFQAVLADAARQRAKAAAASSEGIAAQNADLKQQQQQSAAKGLAGLYGTDTSGMLDAAGQQANDINATINADKQGWLQNAEGVLGTLGSVASGAGRMGIGFGKGQKFG